MSAAIEAAMDAKLKAGQTIKIPATGDSMGPGWDGQIEIGPLRKGEPKLGQVLLIEQARAWVLHRLLWKRKGRYLTRGDQSHSCDPWIDRERIHGIVRYKKGKRVRRWRPWITLCLRTLSRWGG